MLINKSFILKVNKFGKFCFKLFQGWIFMKSLNCLVTLGNFQTFLSLLLALSFEIFPDNCSSLTMQGIAYIVS